jgi:hypothetical protein
MQIRKETRCRNKEPSSSGEKKIINEKKTNPTTIEQRRQQRAMCNRTGEY